MSATKQEAQAEAKQEAGGHTPTPWAYGLKSLHIYSRPTGDHIATLNVPLKIWEDHRQIAYANADLIIKSVNAYATHQSALAAKDERIRDCALALTRITELVGHIFGTVNLSKSASIHAQSIAAIAKAALANLDGKGRV